METLAQMYPTTTIRISAYDESMGWAVTIEYANGDSIETEGEPDHKFLVEDMGEDCWRCGDGYDDYTDADREEYGCPSTAK
jgi:hypothetical protein